MRKKGDLVNKRSITFPDLHREVYMKRVSDESGNGRK